MGWGYYLEARRNHGTDHEERKELIDWHKFDNLYNAIRGIVRYEIPTVFSDKEEDENREREVVVNKEQIRKILHELIELPDYWATYEGEPIVPNVYQTEGFSTVEKMCDILNQYDQIVDAGWEIVFFYG